MDKREKLALFLGMLSGEGYRDYAVRFCNTDKNLVSLFEGLFFDIFGEHGRISYEDRTDKKRLFSFCKYSKKIVNNVRELGFPEGVKRDVLRVPKIIKNGERGEKIAFFIGLLITDGCMRENGSISFHLGSKVFLEEISELVSEFTGINKPIKEYIQRERFKSYQLNLSKSETRVLLSDMPTWDNGTPLVLRF